MINFTFVGRDSHLDFKLTCPFECKINGLILALNSKQWYIIDNRKKKLLIMSDGHIWEVLYCGASVDF